MNFITGSTAGTSCNNFGWIWIIIIFFFTMWATTLYLLFKKNKEINRLKKKFEEWIILDNRFERKLGKRLR